MVHPFSPTAEGICRENPLPEGQRNFKRKLSHAFALSFRSSLLHVSFPLTFSIEFKNAFGRVTSSLDISDMEQEGLSPPFGSLVGLG